MTLQQWGELASVGSQVFSMLAIVAAAGRYFWARDVQSGETLRHLEERFRHFHSSWTVGDNGERMPPVTRAIEIDNDEFRRCGLESALRKGIAGRHAERDDGERAWIPRLDELLRFLMVVGAMEANRLLKRRALWDAYHYWFRTIDKNVLVRTYIGLHFPVLHRFLASNREQLDHYEQLHLDTAAAAMNDYLAHNALVARDSPEQI